MPRLRSYLHQVMDQTFENIKILCHANIVYTLWSIGTKSCPHSAGKQNRSDFITANRIQSGFAKLFFLFLDFRKLHGFQWCNSATFCFMHGVH